MKSIRWTLHALQNLTDREIDQEEVNQALDQPTVITPGQIPRSIYMRPYFDKVLQQKMLLRVIVEETIGERVVVSVYKTSQITRYLKGHTS